MENMNSMSKKVSVAYCRVSTEGQAAEDKFGIESQKKIIQDYADSHNYVIQNWYVDEGVSGVADLETKNGIKGKAQFKMILDDNEVKNPPIQYVLVAKSDRIARDIKYYYYYMMLLEKKGINLVSCTEEIVNDETGLGQVYKSLMLFVAEQERKNITARTSGGRAVKASKGGYSGGGAPLGYKVVNKQLVVDEEEAEKVRYIYKLREDEGLTIRALVDRLNKEGITTKRGNKFNTHSLLIILNNRKTYEGFYHYGKTGEWVKGEQEAILQPKGNDDE